MVVSDHARAEVIGEVIGKGADSYGHVDCMEIVQGKDAVASAVPRLEVRDDTAKLTHEAAIGSVDKRQVQTLMARGLSEGEAVDTILRGLLR
ncbi:MAG: SufD family Fe-S cluster assembly protein [Fidelibacterota bacterium]